MHFSKLLSPNGILPAAKLILRPSLAFSYIGSVTAQHSSGGRQPNFVAWYKEWNYGTFTEGATYIRLGGDHVWIGPHSSIILHCITIYRLECAFCTRYLRYVLG